MERGEAFFSEIIEEASFSRREQEIAADHDSINLGAAFKESMRRLAAGTCAISVEQGAELLGFTATSVTSLSMEPPSLLVSIRSTSRALPVLRKERRFAVHLLSELQSHTANALAGRSGEEVRSAALLKLHGGGPDDGADAALCRIDCQVAKLIPIFSHVLVAGVIENIQLKPEGKPLVYFGGRFCGIGKAVD